MIWHWVLNNKQISTKQYCNLYGEVYWLQQDLETCFKINPEAKHNKVSNEIDKNERDVYECLILQFAYNRLLTLHSHCHKLPLKGRHSWFSLFHKKLFPKSPLYLGYINISNFESNCLFTAARLCIRLTN